MPISEHNETNAVHGPFKTCVLYKFQHQVFPFDELTSSSDIVWAFFVTYWL